MQAEMLPLIDLAAYEHDAALEKCLLNNAAMWAAPPLVVGGVLVTSFFDVDNPAALLTGLALLFTGAILVMVVARFKQLQCGTCYEPMTTALADFTRDDFSSNMLAAWCVEIEDRCYYEEDAGWVRKLKIVRTCPSCNTFVTCGRYDRPCTADERREIAAARS